MTADFCITKSQGYYSWGNMKARCLNPSHKFYESYGGRGIKVCERWMTFANFLEDMGTRPTGTTLDRKDNDGDYEPANCRWATPKQQARNTRSSRLFTLDGETLCATEWEERLGLGHNGVLNRIDKLGWSLRKALTTPAIEKYRKATK